MNDSQPKASPNEDPLTPRSKNISSTSEPSTDLDLELEALLERASVSSKNPLPQPSPQFAIGLRDRVAKSPRARIFEWLGGLHTMLAQLLPASSFTKLATATACTALLLVGWVAWSSLPTAPAVVASADVQSASPVGSDAESDLMENTEPPLANIDYETLLDLDWVLASSDPEVWENLEIQ